MLAIIPVKTKKSKILWFNISFFKREVKVLVGKTEAAVQSCSWEKVFCKYAANLQKNTHAKV